MSKRGFRQLHFNVIDVSKQYKEKNSAKASK